MVLESLGQKYSVPDWENVGAMFDNSGMLITQLCMAAKKRDRAKMSGLILKIADIEEEAYGILINSRVAEC
ncbi:MAG: hypothetical protein FJW66_06500 [Actinobacteria bacterium]|nr:hypothetical protein [Actinomycetota bacterium]